MPATQPTGVYPVTVRVTDDGSPQLNDARSFTITVTPKPAFVGEQRLYAGKGRRRKLVGFQLNFSSALDPGVVQGVGHYHITQPGRTRRSKPQVVPVRTASYNPRGNSVTLTLGKYNTRKPLTVTATGLIGANGTLMADFTTRL